MEEAEALATNVAIMGTRMLAKGTLSQLQEEHGGHYSIRAVRTPESSAQEVERMVKDCFDSRVMNYEDRHGQIGFNLPHDKSALGSILKIMERLKGDPIEEQEGAGAVGSSDAMEARVRVVQDYTVSPPTLEEVFMKVAKETGAADGV